jgi:hypothetical protein
MENTVQIEHKDAFIDDALKHNVFSNYFYNLIKNNLLKSENKSLNIALTAPWGSGKTYFLKNFQAKFNANKDDIYIAYYSSWSNDEYDNAIAPFVSLLIETLNLKKSEDDNIKNFLTSASTILSYFSKILATNIIKYLFELKSPIMSKAIKTLFNGASLENLKAELNANDMPILNHNELDDYDMYIEAKNSFKISLGKYLETHKKRLIILVDELDRCKPSFALQTLEIVKHLFDIDNIIFVFGTDIDNLSSVIKKEYGSDIDPAGYLRRFFDYQFDLPQLQKSDYIESKLMEISFSNHKRFIKLILHFNLSIRDIDIYVKNLKLISDMNFKNSPHYIVYLNAYFLILKMKHPEMFQLITSKNFKFEKGSPIEKTDIVYPNSYYLNLEIHTNSQSKEYVDDPITYFIHQFSNNNINKKISSLKLDQDQDLKAFVKAYATGIYGIPREDIEDLNQFSFGDLIRQTFQITTNL